MLERKNIDRVFQENFKDLEIQPNDKVWQNIEKSLHKKDLKPAVPLWRKLSGVAMVLLFLSSVSVWYFNSETNSIPPIVNPVNQPSVPTETVNSIPVTQTPIDNKNPQPKNNYTNLTKAVAKNTQQPKPIIIEAQPAHLNSDFKFEPDVVQNQFITKQTQKQEPFQISINEALADNNQNTQKQSLEKEKKWSVGPTVSPIYYNSLSSGSPLDESLAQNDKSSDNALSVGVKVNYQLTKKINLQSGINRVELAYNTKNVNARFANAKAGQSNIKNNYSGVVLSANNPKHLNPNNEVLLRSSSLNGSLNQSLEYLEWPLEVKYNLYESKFGVNVIGGFSTMFLTNNAINLNAPNYSTRLGKANNLNSVNFSGNLGIDLDYKINSNWYLNVAPMFKYQFNTYSSQSGNFQPYFLGVYSGLNYRF